MLRTLILTLHNNPSGCVGYTNRGVSLIDMLPPGSAGSIGVDFNIRGLDVHHYFILHLGVNEHRGERGVAPTARVKGRYAYQAVDADTTNYSPCRPHGDAGRLPRGRDRLS